VSIDTVFLYLRLKMDDLETVAEAEIASPRAQ